jgi:hypothetical protein
MDGEQAFLEALNYVSSHMRADIYRVNQLLHGPLPWLDDLEKLDGLAESSFSAPDELVQAVLGTGTLFFELDGCPTTRQGTIFCEGSILCTSTQPRKLIGRILAEIPGAEFQIDHQRPLGLVGEDNGCHLCGYYRKKVSFTVNSLDETLTIQGYAISYMKPGLENQYSGPEVEFTSHKVIFISTVLSTVFSIFLIVFGFTLRVIRLHQLPSFMCRRFRKILSEIVRSLLRTVLKCCNPLGPPERTKRTLCYRPLLASFLAIRIILDIWSSMILEVSVFC